MTTAANQQTLLESEKRSNQEDSLVDSVKILSDITRRDIEKSYNFNSMQRTEAYYSNRYGWTLRRTVE